MDAGLDIQIGQDGLGRWAWMLVDEAGKVVASDDDYYEAQLALESAMRRKWELEHAEEEGGGVRK